MIALVYGDAEKSTAEAGEVIFAAVRNALGQADTAGLLNLLLVTDIKKWPAATAAWDDLTIVLFSKALSNEKADEIAKTTAGPFLLVDLSGKRNPLPPPLDQWKPFSGPKGDWAAVANRVAALLGLRLRGKNKSLLISYRQSDGAGFAGKLKESLANEGFAVDLDAAREEYTPGNESQFQDSLEESLQKPGLLLLVDSPQAAKSTWLRWEIDLANSHLLPVLPVQLGKLPDKAKYSTFPSLERLHRACAIPTPPPANKALPPEILTKVLREIESYLGALLRRRQAFPEHVQHEFTRRGFEWTPLRPACYWASKKNGSPLPATRVSVYCSARDGVRLSEAQACADSLGAAAPPAPNHCLYIFDGPILSAVEMDNIRQALSPEAANLTLLHHQQLGRLLDSNFTDLGL